MELALEARLVEILANRCLFVLRTRCKYLLFYFFLHHRIRLVDDGNEVQ